MSEFHQLERLQQHPLVRSKMIAEVSQQPIWELSIGSQQRNVPTLGIYAGIHGNEHIGSQVVMTWLEHLVSCLAWDSILQKRLESIRIISIPMINVTGLAQKTRANAQGVDLMRNAPIRAEKPYIWPLAGQMLSPKLPWFCGHDLMPESNALIASVLEAWQASSFMMAIDFHSGFGSKDRLWFPYAAHHNPPPHLAEAVALCDLFNQHYPLHDFYRIEPQSLHYTTHGDLWDYIYDIANTDRAKHIHHAHLLPFTLEMGSWLWLKKNPLQFFQQFGMFHPILPHRIRRVLRQHWTILDFCLRATYDFNNWLPNDLNRLGLYQAGIDRWYS